MPSLRGGNHAGKGEGRMDYSKIIEAMTAQRPDWWIEWADQTDLRQLTSGLASPDQIKTRIVADKIMVAYRAAVHAGLLHE